MKMDKIAILIPCYNEAATIEKVVKDMKAALPEATVYVYDNNSSDDTAALAARADHAEHRRKSSKVIIGYLRLRSTDTRKK